MEYRKEVERSVQDGAITQIGRQILEQWRVKLALTSEIAAAIEAEILKPYQDLAEIVLPPLQVPAPRKNKKEERRLSFPRKKVTSSDFAEVLKESEIAYSRKTGKSLSDIQRLILQGA
jgi:hypothetical protein